MLIVWTPWLAPSAEPLTVRVACAITRPAEDIASTRGSHARCRSPRYLLRRRRSDAGMAETAGVHVRSSGRMSRYCGGTESVSQTPFADTEKR